MDTYTQLHTRLNAANNQVIHVVEASRQLQEQHSYPLDPQKRLMEAIRGLETCEATIKELEDGQGQIESLSEKLRYRYKRMTEDEKTKFAEQHQLADRTLETIAVVNAAIAALKIKTATFRADVRSFTILINHPGQPEPDESEQPPDALSRISPPQTEPQPGTNITEHNQSIDTTSTQPVKVTAHPPTYGTHGPTPAPGIWVPKLPDIEIPKFNGDGKKFQHFWTIFNRLVHSNPTLTDLQKLYHLSSCLQDKAAEFLLSYEMEPDFYPQIIEDLRERYGRPSDRRVDLQIALEELPPATRNPMECATTYDNIVQLLTQLGCSGVEVKNGHNPFLLKIIKSKFPEHVIRPVVKHFLEINRDDITVKEFLKQLNQEIVMNVRLANEMKTQGKNDPRAEEKRDNKYNKNRQDNNQYKNKTTSGPENCLVCRQPGHVGTNCPTITDPVERWTQVRKVRGCWICYRKHERGQCQSTDRCSRCAGHHRQEICHLIKNPQSPAQYTGQNVTNTVAKTAPPPQTRTFSAQAKGPVGPGAAAAKTTATTTGPVHTVTHMGSGPKQEHVALMTVKGKVKNHKTKELEKLLFLFDGGAQSSFITAEAAKRLELPVHEKTTCSVSGSGGHVEHFITEVVALTIQTNYLKDIEIELKTKPHLVNPFRAVFLTPEDIEALEIKQIQAPNTQLDGSYHTPDVIIGLDLIDTFIPVNNPESLPSGIKVTKTIVGNCFYGKGTLPPAETETQTTTVTVSTLMYSPPPEKTYQEMVKEMYEMESSGFTLKAYETGTAADAFYQAYKDHIDLSPGHAIAPLPVKDNINELTDNFNVAYRCLEKLLGKLQQNPLHLELYTQKINNYRTNGEAEIVTGPIPNTVGIFYLPHQPVWRWEKTDPLRIVFNASAHGKGKKSLNDVLHTGEAYVHKIHDIIAACRFHKLLITCDIQSAFTQIRLPSEYQDLCRFLYPKDPTKPLSRDNLQVYRFVRLPFGLTASPSVLNMVLTKLCAENTHPIAKEILQYLYVDNIVLFADTVTEAIQKYEDSKAVLAQITMNLREYASNSEEFNQSLPIADRGKFGQTKMLGVGYNTEEDNFLVQIMCAPVTKLTKRELLAIMHSVYDPIGAAQPALLPLKLLFREVVKTLKNWGDQLEPEKVASYNAIIQNIEGTEIKIPRDTKSSPETQGKLWIFADASTSSIAACAHYQRAPGASPSAILSGKNKLAPMKKPLTVPQLELQGLLMAATLAKTLSFEMTHLKFGINIVSDSRIALAWIKNISNHSKIANTKDKINKIAQELATNGHTVNFFHVPTDLNPADLGTRGASKQQLEQSAWVQGPQWVADPEEIHPLTPLHAITATEEEETLAATLDEKVPEAAQILTQTANETPEPLLGSEKFSSYQRKVRVISLVAKAIQTWVNKVNKTRDSPIRLATVTRFDPSPAIGAKDIAEAELLLIRQAQNQLNMEELHKRHRDYRFFQDHEGIIRCQTRLNKAELPYDTVHPIFLPRKTDWLPAFLRELHLKLAHSQHGQLAVALRARYLIPKVGKLIKEAATSCVTCRKVQGLPLGAPDMQALQKDRVTCTRAFTSTGTDYLGPITIKGDKKVYVCLFTCMATRATHLEVAEDLTAGAFLNCFTRFISDKGVPKIIRSDQGTNYTLGQKILEILHQPEPISGESVLSYSANHKIQWIFNPPASPWMGGAWERLIGLTKRHLKKLLGRQRVTLDTLQTLVKRIAAVLNTRPLTHVNPNEMEQLPLRPVDFLQNSVSYALAEPQLEGAPEDKSYEPELIQTMKQAKEAVESSTRLADKYWARWKKDYLPTIKNIHKYTRKQKRHLKRKFPILGEIVLIGEDNRPRGSWAYGRVDKIFPSEDGQIRSVLIKTATGSLRRPLEKIFPLEIRALQTIPEKPEEEKQADPSPGTDPSPDHSTPLKNRAIKERAETAENDKQPYPSQVTAPQVPITSPELETKGSTRPAREAKTRGKLLIQAYETAMDEDPPLEETIPKGKKIGSLNKLTTALLIMTLLNPVDAKIPMISCKDGEVQIPPNQWEQKICVEEICHSFPPDTEPRVFYIPHTTGTATATVTVTTHGITEKTQCAPVSFCGSHDTFLSKGLIGNPQCSPGGAIWSIAILILMVALTVATCCFCGIKGAGWRQHKLQKRRRQLLESSTAPSEGETTDYLPLTNGPTGKKALDKQTSEETEQDEEPGPSNTCGSTNFHLKRDLKISLRPKFALATGLALIAMAQGCQDAYSTTNTGLICDEATNCHMAYRREINFNKAHNLACVGIQFEGKTVGHIKIKRRHDTMTCNKQSLFYTRETEPHFDSSHSCVTFGNCAMGDQNCINWPHNRLPDAFKNTLGNYTSRSTCQKARGCSSECSCWAASKTCVTTTVTHQPVNKEIFEAFRCANWEEGHTFDVETEMYDKKTVKTIHPVTYIPTTVDGWNITIVRSQPRKDIIMNRDFLQSAERTMILPPEYRLPVRCPNKEAAKSALQNCTEQGQCSCTAALDPICTCQHTSITRLRLQEATQLPLAIPDLDLIPDYPLQKTVVAETYGEMTLVLEMDYKLNSYQTITQEPCQITASSLNGCYSCPFGAHTQVTCTAAKASYTIFQCGKQLHSIRCTPAGEANYLRLYTTDPDPAMKCKARCGRKFPSVTLKGELNYSPEMGINTTFLKTKPSGSKMDWITSPTTFPSLKPLWRAIKNHPWITLGAGLTVVATGAFAYMGGGKLLIMLLPIAFKAAEILMACWDRSRKGAACCRGCWGLICDTCKEKGQKNRQARRKPKNTGQAQLPQ